MIKMTGGKQAGRMDLLTGSLGDKILRFAVPLAATGILQQLFNAADIAVIGRFVGKHAMAAVGSNAPLIGLLVNLFLGISMGTNVVVARYIGEGNEANIRKAVHTAIVLALGGGIALTVIGEIVTAPILHLMGVPPEIYDLSVLYMRVYLTGMPVILLYNFESAIFRSRGDTKTPLFCLTISGLINVALNVFFVVVIGMTVNGVALATVISNLISSALLFRFLMKAEGPVRVEPGRLRIHTDVLRLMLQIGIPYPGILWSGLYDFCRTELRRRQNGQVQKDTAPCPAPGPGRHRDRCPSRQFLWGADAAYFQYRSGCGKVWNDPSALHSHGPSFLCLCGDDLRSYARLRLFSLPCVHVAVWDLWDPDFLGLHGFQQKSCL